LTTVRRRLARLLPLALPASLAVALVAQEEDVGPGRRRTALPRSAYPVAPRAAEVVDPRAGELSEPALIALGGDRALLAWIDYEVGAGDRLLAAEVGRAGVGAPVAVVSQPSRLLAPCGLVEADGRPRLFWIALVDESPRLFSSRLAESGWSAPAEVALPTTAASAIACARARDGATWIAWQAWGERSYDVHCGKLENGSVTAPLAAGTSRFAELAPALVARDDGRLELLFEEYGDRDYEIVARELDPAKRALGPRRNVSSAPLSDDLHPAACAAPGGGVWIAWDEITAPLRSSSNPRDNLAPVDAAVKLVLLEPDGSLLQLEKPALLDPDRTLLPRSGGLPRVALDARGRPRVVFRFLDQQDDEQPGHAYPLATELASGGAMTALQLFEGSDGDLEPAALVRVDSGFVAAWQIDRRAQEKEQGLSSSLPEALGEKLAPRGIFLTGYLGPSKLGVAFVADAKDEAPRAGTSEPPLKLVPRPPPPAGEHFHPLRSPESDPVTRSEQPLRVEADGKVWSVFWGDLHRHSCESRCMLGVEPMPRDRFDFGRDVVLCDFYALTDHSSQIDPHGWWRIGKLVDLFQTPRFVTLPGFEWSTTRFGHYNVIFRESTERIVSSRLESANDPDGLWKNLERGKALTIPHHSAHGHFGNDWSFRDDGFLRVVEIYQALRGSFEADGCFRQAKSATAPGKFVQDALDAGIELGFVASTDHGEGAAYAAVLAEKLDRASVFDALVARRCYASSTKGILVDFRIDGKLMGSSVKCSGPPEIELTLRGTTDLAEITLFRDGEVARRLGRTEPDPRGGATTLELLWWPRGNVTDWSFELGVDAGRFLVPGPEDPTRDMPMMQWTLSQDARSIAWKQVEPPAYRAQVKRFPLKDGEDARIHLVVMGKPLETSVKELRTGPKRGRHRATEWVFRIKQPLENPDLAARPAGGAAFHESWKDEGAPTGRSWYYARVIQADGEVAWSSPIFVERS
jgi:hypothetical protein